MWRSSALCLACLLGVSACGGEIVLGDSLAALPGSSGTGAASGNGGAAGRGGATGSAGTSPSLPDAPIPAAGELVWSTDHEVGDWSEWQQGGEFYGGEYEWGDVNAYVDIGVGRDGSNGVVADINTAARSEPSQGVRLYRRIEESGAYYSAWFRLEDAHSPSDWWSIFLFHARDDSLSLDNDVSLWDVRIVDSTEGDMALQFFDHDLMLGTVAGPTGVIEAGQWFEIRAFLDYRPPSETRLAIWLNGTQLFDMKELHTAVQSNVFWSIGNGAARLDPADSTLNMDDAAIRKARTP